MTDSVIVSIKDRMRKPVFILSLLVSLFWLIGKAINVYRFAIVGAVFEIIWLPAIALTFILPVISFIFLIKEKFSLRSLYLYSFLIIVVPFLLVVWYK